MENGRKWKDDFNRDFTKYVDERFGDMGVDGRKI